MWFTGVKMATTYEEELAGLAYALSAHRAKKLGANPTPWNQLDRQDRRLFILEAEKLLNFCESEGYKLNKIP
jgi:hypothetical protein